jgi:hypothetical protein
MAVTHQRLLLLSLFLASALGQDAMAPAATPTVPRLRFEPALCPKLQGAEELAKASCGYLRKIGASRTTQCPRSAPRRIGSTGSLPAARGHRGDRLGSGEPCASTRSRCPCPRLRTHLWRQLSRKPSVRDPGGARRGRPEGVSELSGLGDTRGYRRLGVFQRRLPRRVESPRRPRGHAPACGERPPDTPHLRQLRYADVACRGQGRGGKLSNATIISIPGVGHAVSPASPCAQTVIVSFLADPNAPDTSCVGAVKPASFATSPRRG